MTCFCCVSSAISGKYIRFIRCKANLKLRDLCIGKVSLTTNDPVDHARITDPLWSQVFCQISPCAPSKKKKTPPSQTSLDTVHRNIMNKCQQHYAASLYNSGLNRPWLPKTDHLCKSLTVQIQSANLALLLNLYKNPCNAPGLMEKICNCW